MIPTCVGLLFLSTISPLQMQINAKRKLFVSAPSNQTSFQRECLNALIK